MATGPLPEDVDPDDGGVPGRRVLRAFVAEVVALEPGPELMAGLQELMGRGLSARERLEVAAAWKTLVSFSTAGQLAAVADLDRALTGDAEAPARPGQVESVRPAADELAPALGIAPRTASCLVALTRRLEADLPGALDALAEGIMDFTQVKILDQVARDLPAGTRAAVEAFAIRRSPRRTAAQLRQDLAAEAARLDPGHAARAAAAGVGERDVALRASPLPGCQRLVADLPRLSASAAWLAVNGAAVAAKDRGVRADGTMEDRGLGQLRADMLAALLTGTADPGQPTVVPAPAELAALAEVQVVVGADTLSGAVDTPAHVPGVGPLDADTARDIAARARWRRLVADPDTGTLIAADPVVLPAPEDDTRAGDDGDVGGDPRLARLLTDPMPTVTLASDRYRPSARLRLHVHTRDATCLGPACSHPSRGTQLDHTIDHGRRDARGVLGVTAEHNLGSLCQRVHNGKTHGGWDLAQPTPGEFVWTSPTGRVYHRRARPLLPGWPQRRRERAEREPQPP